MAAGHDLRPRGRGVADDQAVDAPGQSDLGNPCLVVRRQIDYATKLGIPWGISESAFAAQAANGDYHYQSFGVPGLGLQRGLAEDLVIAPYASALALMLREVGIDYILARLGRGRRGINAFDRRALAEYTRAFNDPRTIHATCEDYRASATIDLVHDQRDRGRLQMPLLALWGKHGVIGALFDCLADWREVAANVAGRALDCGHFIAEEKPQALVAQLRRFLKDK